MNTDHYARTDTQWFHTYASHTDAVCYALVVFSSFHRARRAPIVGGRDAGRSCLPTASNALNLSGAADSGR